jgi:CBS domain containing-hemolysin-like protein
LLATAQVGVTLAGLGAGWAGEDTTYQALLSLFHPVMTPHLAALVRAFSFIVAFLVLTFFMVVLGEVVPKNLGIKQAERYAIVVAPLLLVFYRVSQPFIYVLERSSAACRSSKKPRSAGCSNSRTSPFAKSWCRATTSFRSRSRRLSITCCAH